MAKKIKFALEMADGFMVRRSLEELREHFDLEKAVGYFLDGKLVTWLADRYYEDEAAKLEEIEKDAPDLHEHLCTALGISLEKEVDLDIEQMERLNEKKALLREKTSDESIISHAAQTAFTQEDLADLLDMDEPVIYLCGESFDIPAGLENKKYIGILGIPNIKSRIASQEDAKKRNLVFENVKLPWEKVNMASSKIAVSSCSTRDTEDEGFDGTDRIKKELRENFEVIFGHNRLWDIYDGNIDYMMGFMDFVARGSDSTFEGFRNSIRIKKELTQTEKRILLQKFGLNEKVKDKLIHVMALSDRSAGFAFTTDSFRIINSGENFKSMNLWADVECSSHPLLYRDRHIVPPDGYHVVRDEEYYHGCIGTYCIKYKNIMNAESFGRELFINENNGLNFCLNDTSMLMYDQDGILLAKIAEFLNLAKDVVK